MTIVGGVERERTTIPIACTLDGNVMPDRLREWQALLAHVATRTATPDGGMRLEFDADAESAELMRLVAAEQQCCAFFAFAITVDNRGLALEVRAPDDALEIVTAVFGAPA
jgi:hypothetical protein